MKNIKVILILSVSLFVLFCFTQEAFAQINYAPTGTPSHANQANGSNTFLVWTWQDAFLNDNSTAAVAHGVVISDGAVRATWASFDSIINFPAPIAQLDSIEVVAGRWQNLVYRLMVYVDTGAGWQLVGDTGVHQPVFAGQNTYTFNTGAPWNNVQRIKVYSWALCAGFAFVDYRLFEVRAWGPPQPPTVTTDSSSNSDTTATLNGSIIATGGENPSERGFEWGTVSGVYPSSWTEVGSYGVGAFNRGIAGLAPSTTYYFRAKAQNSAGWAYGAEMSFTAEAPGVTPCAAHDVWGYAWSENIGWISFSCENNTPIDTGVDYGVDIDEANGNLSGYAWSENIGWISFNAGEFGTCPFGFGPCQPNINLTTGEVTGYARVCSVFQTGCSGALRPNSERGGWDGWIRLSGTWANGVVLPPGVGPTSEFEGWAWGGDDASGEEVIGWISFNNITGGGVIDYSVKTGLVIPPPNNAPTAAISCSPASCTIYHTEVLTLNNDSTDPENNITQSEWATSEPPAGYIVRDTCVLCNFTPQNFIGFGLGSVGDYIARLVVDDDGGLSDTDTQAFSILRDAIADFTCSPTEGGPWESCDTIEVIAGELVYFNDQSQASQGGAPIVSREWRRDGGVFSAGNNTNPSVIALAPSMDITLLITDSVVLPGPRTDTALHTIGSVALDLPTWIEVPPF